MTVDSRMACVDTSVQADLASLEQAAQWYATLYDGNADDASLDAWRAWLDARAEHRRAWMHIEAVSRRFGPLRADGERDAAAAAIRVSARRITTRRQFVAGLAGFGSAGTAVWLACRLTPLHQITTAWTSDYHTRIGERKDIVLVDGTHIWLNTASALDVDYSNTRRLVKLKGGEILVETGKDAQRRPFFVETQHGRLQALGTRFTVRQTDPFTVLTVFEGLVEIRTVSGRTERVGAGEQRQFSEDHISDALPADRANESWSRGVILAENIRLDSLLSEVSRYQIGHITVDSRVADIRVSGRYPTDNPEQVLNMLARDLPISVRQTLPWWTSVSAR